MFGAISRRGSGSGNGGGIPLMPLGSSARNYDALPAADDEEEVNPPPANTNAAPLPPPPLLVDENVQLGDGGWRGEDFPGDDGGGGGGGLANEYEHARRQQMIRMGLMFCLLFLLFSDPVPSGSGGSSGTSTGSGSSSSKVESQADEILLSPSYTQSLRSLLESATVPPDGSNEPMVAYNVSGSYRGFWRSYPLPNEEIEKPESIEQVLERNSSAQGGSAVLQFHTVPVVNVSTISFVYGYMRLYDRRSALMEERSFPMQGVLLTASRRLFMFPTPFRGQTMFLDFHNLNETAPLEQISSEEYNKNEDEKPNAERQLASNWQWSVSTEYAENILVSPPQVQELFGNASRYSVLIQHPTIPYTLRVGVRDLFVYRKPSPNHETPVYNYTSPSGVPYVGIPLGDTSLSNRFRMLQVPRSAPKFTNSSSERRLTNSESPIMDFTSQISHINHSWKSYFGKLIHAVSSQWMGGIPYSLQDSTSDEPVSFEDEEEDFVQSHRSLSTIKTESISDELSELSELFVTMEVPLNNENENAVRKAHTKSTKHKNSLSVLPVTDNMLGQILQEEDETFNLWVTSYDFDVTKLESKVEYYSLCYSLVSVLQVVLVVHQLKAMQTPALAAKVSIASLFAQSMLDAIICCAHLLLGTVLPQLFFGPFLWIAITKLLLFSVFQMRAVVVVYRARHAQELAMDGSRDLRANLIKMHVRFYVVVFGVLIMSFMFISRPMLAVFILYSFWWPQIFHSVMAGTKHTFHGAYLYGGTLVRLFLPFYLWVCPDNFALSLWQYMSPSVEIHTHHRVVYANDNSRVTAAAYTLIVWLALQVVILTLQTIYGPRFFVPKQFLPYRYDYKRPLPQRMQPTPVPDAEAGGLLPDGEEPALECIICYNHIECSHRDYMITPCDHVFHETCLKQWINVKLECPVCRASLPTIDEDE